MKLNINEFKDILYELKGDCSLVHIGDSSTPSDEMKEFILLHESKKYKLSDFKKVKDFIKSKYPDKCSINYVTLKKDADKLSVLERKALHITFI